MVDIRRAEKEDIPGIKAVLAVTWRDTYSLLVRSLDRESDSRVAFT
jgi:N-acetylglutamate synthase-like GNAT family acetyltransferase